MISYLIMENWLPRRITLFILWTKIERRYISKIGFISSSNLQLQYKKIESFVSIQILKILLSLLPKMNVSQHHRTWSIMITTIVPAQTSLLLTILKHQFYTITLYKFFNKKNIDNKIEDVRLILESLNLETPSEYSYYHYCNRYQNRTLLEPCGNDSPYFISFSTHSLLRVHRRRKIKFTF